MAVTIRDVARLAGVSQATVSFVLNQTPGQSLRPETKQRVRAAARQLGYTPHRIAQALREGHSRIVLLQAGGLRGGGLASFIAGLDGELQAHGYALVVSYGAGGTPALLDAISPKATLDLNGVFDAADGWGGDFARHTATQLGHLVATGHRRLAFALPESAPPGLPGLRLGHVRDYLTGAGLAPVVVLPVAAERSQVVAALAELRRRHRDVTAIAAFSDLEALRVLGAMSVLSLSAPGDLAVIGFDDDGLGAMWAPALTSVRIDAAGYGRRTARAVLGLGDQPWESPPSVVVVRESA